MRLSQVVLVSKSLSEASAWKDFLEVVSIFLETTKNFEFQQKNKALQKVLILVYRPSE
jgi:hypothetical protein